MGTQGILKLPYRNSPLLTIFTNSIQNFWQENLFRKRETNQNKNRKAITVFCNIIN